jgi:hypothetical protein
MRRQRTTLSNCRCTGWSAQQPALWADPSCRRACTSRRPRPLPMAMLGFGRLAQEGIGRKYGGLCLLNTPAAVLRWTSSTSRSWSAAPTGAAIACNREIAIPQPRAAISVPSCPARQRSPSSLANQAHSGGGSSRRCHAGGNKPRAQRPDTRGRHRLLGECDAGATVPLLHRQLARAPLPAALLLLRLAPLVVLILFHHRNWRRGRTRTVPPAPERRALPPNAAHERCRPAA